MVHYCTLEYRSGLPDFEFETKKDPSFSTGFSVGWWLDPAKAPLSAIQTNRVKKYCDIFPLPGTNAVSQRFKDLVDEFEPGLHQFFPLQLKNRDGEPLEERYYIFNCHVLVEAVLFEESGVTWRDPSETTGGRPGVNIKYRHEELVLSGPAVEGHHLWAGCYLHPAGMGVFCSEAFYKELKKRKIKHLEFYPCRVSERPWVASENIQPFLDWQAGHEEEDWHYRAKGRAEAERARRQAEG